MTSATAEQMKMLLQYMQEHTNLSRGRLQKTVEGKIRAKALWSDLANQLNATGGAVKTVVQWQKVWADRKYLAKKAAAAAKRSASGTGGGPAGPPLSQEQEAIASIMGDGYGLPQTNAVVDPFPLTPETADAPVAVYVPILEEDTPGQLPTTPIDNTPIAEDSQQSGPSSRPRATPLAGSNQRPRSRWRSLHHQDFRSLLQESEALKRAELAGIRGELREGIRGELREINTSLRDLVIELRQIREKLS